MAIAALLFQRKVLIPDSIRVRAESRYFLFQVSTKGGTTSGVLARVILSVLALFVRSLQRLRPETEIRYEQEWARNYGQVCRYDSGSAGTEMRRIRRRLRCQQD